MRIIIEIIIGIVASFLLIISTGLDFFFTLILSFIIGFLFMAIVETIIDKTKKSIYNRSSDVVEYDENTFTLTVKNRVPKLKKFIKIVSIDTLKTNYVDEKYVYTSATVGGITTGGVHKTGGYYETNVVGSGKYKIMFKSSQGLKEIFKIDISGSETLDSEGLKAMEKNKISVNPFAETSVSDMIQNMTHGSYLKIMHNGEALADLERLSFDECQKIIKWLCGGKI